MGNDRMTTSTLLGRLFKTGNVGNFIEHNNKEMDTASFSDYLSSLCDRKNMLPSYVISKSDIERSYGYQLFKGRRTPSRDKVIQLAFGFGMGYEEAQELLKAARMSPLYPRIKRDAVIIYALKRGIKLVDVQVTLEELGLPLIGEKGVS